MSGEKESEVEVQEQGEVNPYDFDVIAIHNGAVHCPWWQERVRLWDTERGCMTECEFGNGSAEGAGVECLWRASGSPPKPQ